MVSIKLNYLLAPWVDEQLPSLAINNMQLDSRKISKGDLFCALSGSRHNGTDFITAAIEQGAVAVVYQGELDPKTRQHAFELKTPLIYIKNLNRQLSAIAARFYDYPGKKLQLIGVTGTDGKTSVVNFLQQAINHAQKKALCASIGTLGFCFDGECRDNTHTTPDAIAVQQSLAEFLSRGASTVVMEVSSHALAQGRVNALQFKVAILTNFARDHMDYHHNTAAYAAAKRKLFANLKAEYLVLNGDDDFGCMLARELKQQKKIVYGFSKDLPLENMAKVSAANLQQTARGISFEINMARHSAAVELPILGAFNAYNILAVAATMLAIDNQLAAISQQYITAISNKLNALQAIDGRMQPLSFAPLVLVDYAHTPQALETVLKALKLHQNKAGKLYCVFGCGGNRDTEKRSKMGAIATLYADWVIITSDNPRHEDEQKIIDDIVSGIETDNYQIQTERSAAIKLALGKLKKADTLLVAGKGHEQTQQIGAEKIFFDDVKVLEQHMAELASASNKEPSQ